MSSANEDRNAEICARYEAGDSAEVLALDFGLSLAMVRVILRTGGVRRTDKNRVFKSDEEKVLSPTHLKIGNKLAYFRAFEFGVDRRTTADKLGWSMQRVAAVEKGSHNLTLFDLQDLAAFMKISIEELIRDSKQERQGVLEHGSSAGVDQGLSSPASTGLHSDNGGEEEGPTDSQSLINHHDHPRSEERATQ